MFHPRTLIIRSENYSFQLSLSTIKIGAQFYPGPSLAFENLSRGLLPEPKLPSCPASNALLAKIVLMDVESPDAENMR